MRSSTAGRGKPSVRAAPFMAARSVACAACWSLALILVSCGSGPQGVGRDRLASDDADMSASRNRAGGRAAFEATPDEGVVGAPSGRDGWSGVGGADRAPEAVDEPRIPGDSAATRGPAAPPAAARRPDARATGDATPRAPRSPTSPEVRAILAKLQGTDATAATDAFWHLAEVDRRLIPELIPEVENPARSAITELTILVRDANFQGFLVSNISGLGVMERFDGDDQLVWKGYDDKPAVGLAPNHRGFKVVIRNRAGFPVGVVLRAALLNRFRSVELPAGIDHKADLIGWWWAYYRNVFG